MFTNTGVDKKRAARERMDPLLRWIHFLLKKKRIRSTSPPNSVVSANTRRISYGGCV